MWLERIDWASIRWLTWSYIKHDKILPSLANVVFCFGGASQITCQVGAKQRFLLIKERFRLPENLRGARYLPSVFVWVLAARKTNVTTARARKNKRSARMLAKIIRYPFFELGRVSRKRTHLEQRKNTNLQEFSEPNVSMTGCLAVWRNPMTSSWRINFIGQTMNEDFPLKDDIPTTPNDWKAFK